MPLTLCLVLPLSLAAVTPQPAVVAQTAPAATRQLGTIKSVSPDGLVLTTAAGQDVSVTLPAPVKVLLLPPGSHDLSAAQPGTVADIQPGDRALVTGTASGNRLEAARVVVMKGTAIAATHEAEEAAWTHGVGGIVKSIDPATGTLTVASGAHTTAVHTSASTSFRQYAPGSVKFSEATMSSLSAIHPGDQLRARGTRSPDSSVLTADAIVSGSFGNYAGTLTSVNAQDQTVTLKDLATKRNVTVAIKRNSDLRRIPEAAAEHVALRLHGGGAAGTTADDAGGGEHRQTGHASANHAAESTENETGDAAARRSAGADLSQMMERLPTQSLGDLKVGDTVMIVATEPAPGATEPTVITLLAGVAPILTASPAGQAVTLSPWTLGGGEQSEGTGTGNPQ